MRPVKKLIYKNNTLHEKNLPVLLALAAVLIIASCKKDTKSSSCAVATGMTTLAITASNATLSWTPVTGAASYLVQYRVVGTTTWTPGVSDTSTYVATGLTANTKYEWQVETVCTSGGSAYTASTNFTTLTNTQPPVLIHTSNQTLSQGGLSVNVVTTNTYDSQNRLSTQVSNTTTSTGILVTDTIYYTYTSTTVTVADQQLGTVVYTLNASGYRTSDDQGDTWTYNAGGYLTGSNIQGVVSTYTYDVHNNLSTQSQNTNPGTQLDTYTYPASPLSMPVIAWQTGNSTGALYTTDVQVVNSVTTTFSATYTTDAQSRVTQSVVTSTAGITNTTNYTYY